MAVGPTDEVAWLLSVRLPGGLTRRLCMGPNVTSHHCPPSITCPAALGGGQGCGGGMRNKFLL